jgi:hypothetical protein
MAKKSTLGVSNFRGSTRKKRRGRHSKSPNKSFKRSFKPYRGQGRV